MLLWTSTSFHQIKVTIVENKNNSEKSSGETGKTIACGA